MTTTTSRKVLVGLLAAGLLAAALLVAGTRDGRAGPTDPSVIRLTYGKLLAEVSYRLEGTNGARDTSIDVFRGRLLDEDGNVVGTHRCECLNATGPHVGWFCTHVLSLRRGPSTGFGSVIVSGLFRGFSGESAVITGGTGAYAGVRGYAVSTVEGDEFVQTLHLEP
jgi:hypothetical protein